MTTPQHPSPQPPHWLPVQALQSAIPHRDRGARWLAIVGVFAGVAGLACGVWSIASRPESAMVETVQSTTTVEADDNFTPDEVAAAKTKICTAYEFVSSSVANANAPRDSGGDEGLRNAYVALSQISLVSGAAYLQDQLDPALQGELREMVELLIYKYLRVAVGGAGGGIGTYESDVAEANVTTTEVKRLCR